MFTRASLYYMRCTTRNRVVGMLKKLKQPKYIIGLSLTVAYFWFLFGLYPMMRGDIVGSVGGAAATEESRGENAGLIVGCFYVFQVVFSWFALSSGRGVAFRESEVQLLFPRPFTRWQILLLKWMGTLFGTLIGGLLIGLMFRRFGEFDYTLVVLGFLLNQTALYTNATLIGLWLARMKAKGGLAAHFVRLPAWLLLFAIAGAVAVGWRGVGSVESFADFKLVLNSDVVRSTLWPFTSLAEVMMQPDLGSFALMALFPIGLIAAQVFLIWALDFRFEDQAVEIAAKIQNIKKEGMGALRDKKDLIVAKPSSPWELAPTGPAWRALVWKNLISLGRFPRRTWIRIVVVVLLLGVFLSNVVVDEDGHSSTRIGFLLIGLLFYVSLLAPSMVRVDLRIDIPHFDMLKAMPIRGRSLVFGEIMGTVVALWFFQVLICLIVMFLVQREGDVVFTWAMKIPGLVALLCAFFALDFAWVTAENLMALWFPGFTRLGRGIRTGFDQIGQNLMGALIRMLGLLVLFVVPAVVGAVVGAVLAAVEVNVVLASSAGVVVGSVLLYLESWVMILFSDARYDRFDITSENIVEE